MFKISNVKTRYYELEAPDSGKVIFIEPPKLKTLRNLENLSRQDSPTIESMAEQIARVISKNKAGRKVTADQVMEWMTTDELSEFISDYLRWLNKEKTSDPN